MAKELSKTQIDVMHEVINIGTGHAADALSRLLDEKVMVEVPDVKMVPIGKVPDHLGGPELPIVGIYFRFSGDLSGSILLFIPESVIATLIEFLTAGIPLDDPAERENVQRSALMELGNIVANSYINAIAELMDMRIFISVPYYAQDLLGALVDVLLIQIAEAADVALLLETLIMSQQRQIDCNLAIFLDDESLEKVFTKTGLNNG